MQILLPVRLTSHAQKRLSKRFGIKSKEAAQRFADDIVKNGTVIPMRSELITIVRRGHSFVFAKVEDFITHQLAMLMITACNDDKSSEWKCFHHGKARKLNTIKQSKVHQSVNRRENKN
ncbi:MAG: hypothetical protein WC680_03470 [Sulfuricurvum sp.]|jgi:hypothetical protein